MQLVGIVGAEGAKFTLATEREARAMIRAMLLPGDVVVSGGCHLGGVDIWAEEEARLTGHPDPVIFLPKSRSWEHGYKQRNIQIAQCADVVHCLVVGNYPPGYTGMRFPRCYHCNTTDHIKSGGCWTVKIARNFGKPGYVWRVGDWGLTTK